MFLSIYIWNYQNRKITIPIDDITISLRNNNCGAIIYSYRGANNWDVEQIDIDPEARPTNNITERERWYRRNRKHTKYKKLTNLDCGNLLCNFFKKYNKYPLNFECSITLPSTVLISDDIAKISFDKPYIRPTCYWNMLHDMTYYRLSMRL
jgi:hypothetical protein